MIHSVLRTPTEEHTPISKILITLGQNEHKNLFNPQKVFVKKRLNYFGILPNFNFYHLSLSSACFFNRFDFLMLVPVYYIQGTPSFLKFSEICVL